ncbi:hypothetical protein ACQY0O_007763 [Thecaphora frezii]
MSQSLKSWLLGALVDQAHEAEQSGSTLRDLPFVQGSRIQLIRFLTFRPTDNPLADQDVWAIVGDRTHLVAAKFVRGQVTRYQKHHPTQPFTSLRGSLFMLRTIRAVVTRIPSTTRATLWRPDEYNLAIEVRSFDLLGSLGEPTFWPDAHLVLSPRGVPAGSEEGWKTLVRWTDRWIQYRGKRDERKRASETLKALHGTEAHNDESLDTATGVTGQLLPTPAQRTRSDPRATHLTRSSERTSRSYSDSRLFSSSNSHGHGLFSPLSKKAAAAARKRGGSEWEGYNLDAVVPSTQPAMPSDTPLHESTDSDSAAENRPRGQEGGVEPQKPTRPQQQGEAALPSCTLGNWEDEYIPDPAELGLSVLEPTQDGADMAIPSGFFASQVHAVPPEAASPPPPVTAARTAGTAGATTPTDSVLPPSPSAPGALRTSKRPHTPDHSDAADKTKKRQRVVRLLPPTTTASASVVRFDTPPSPQPSRNVVSPSNGSRRKQMSAQRAMRKSEAKVRLRSLMDSIVD